MPKKCFWYMIQPTWNSTKSKWGYEEPDTSHCLQVPDDASSLATIPQLATSEAQRKLRVHIAPDGNDEVEYNYLLETVQQWQTSMATSKVMHLAVEFGIQQMITRKLEYPLATTCFTQQQCDNIMQPIPTQGLLAAGIVWSFP